MSTNLIPMQLRVRRDAMMAHLAYLILAAKTDDSLIPQLDAATLEMDEINNMLDRIRRQRQVAA